MSENSEKTPTPSENSVEAVEEKTNTVNNTAKNNSAKNNSAKNNSAKNNSAVNNSAKNNNNKNNNAKNNNSTNNSTNTKNNNTKNNNTKNNNTKNNSTNNGAVEEDTATTSGGLNAKINEILPLLKKIEELKASYKNATNESKEGMKSEFEETKSKIIELQTEINNEIGAMSIETNALSFFKNSYPEYAESLEKLNVFKSNAPVEMGANQSNASEANVSMVKNNNKKNNATNANVSMVKNNTKKNNATNANVSMVKNNNGKTNELNVSMIKNNNGKVNEVNVSMVKNNSKKNNAAANVSMTGGKRKTRKNRKNRKN